MSDRRTSARPTAATPMAMDDDDLVREILLRVPPLPSSLPRASLVCKRWRRVVSDPWFLRRFHAHLPPLLGFFEQHGDDIVFIPVLDSPDRVRPQRLSLPRPADPSRGAIDLLSCRHGLVAFVVWTILDHVAVVFDPCARACVLRTAVPPEFPIYVDGAVLCCAPTHADGSSSRRPFKLVLVSERSIEDLRPIACVYSSETGVWGDIIRWHDPCNIAKLTGPGALVGHAIYWLLTFETDNDDFGHDHDHMLPPDGMLEFDLDTQSLTLTKGLPAGDGADDLGLGVITAAVDGGVGIVTLSCSPTLHLQMWRRRRKLDDRDGAWTTTWDLFKTVDLQNMLVGVQLRERHRWAMPMSRKFLLGYDEDEGVIFIRLDLEESSLFMVQPVSM